MLCYRIEFCSIPLSNMFICSQTREDKFCSPRNASKRGMAKMVRLYMIFSLNWKLHNRNLFSHYQTWYQMNSPLNTVAGVELVAGAVLAIALVASGQESIGILWGSNSWRWRTMKMKLRMSWSMKIKPTNNIEVPEAQSLFYVMSRVQSQKFERRYMAW